MPLPGGASDKYGNRYEGKWTAYCIAQVMAEEADSIRIEPPGPDGDGCEFTLYKGNIVEYHQVKRQHARPGEWTIPELARNGVLGYAFTKTRDPGSHYVFVSTVGAGLLVGLTDDARRAESLSEFKGQFLKGAKTNTWSELLREWEGPIQRELNTVQSIPSEMPESARCRIVYERLKRVRFRAIDEDSLVELVDTKLRALVRTDAPVIREALCAMALDRIHETLHGDAIWSHIESRGHARVDYAKDASVVAALIELNARYESMIRGIGAGITVPREETATLGDILSGVGEKTSALVSGTAGVGKTCVLGQVIHQLRAEDVPHLYFRVDRLEPTDLPRNVAVQLGLPSTPAEVLAGVAHGRPCVLVIDQLDAVSLVSGRNPEFFHCVHEIIRQALAFPNMRLLMACRRFDLQKDNRLRELVAEHGVAQEVNVQPFTVEGVKGVLEELGCNPSQYGERQVELLRLPLHLALFAELIQQPRETPLTFATSVDLFSAYWDMKRMGVRSRMAPDRDQWIEVLDRLCDRMTKNQTLFVKERDILDEFERTVRTMESEHVLVLDRNRVGFFHEGFFDYVFARRFLAKGGDIARYLKDGEQDLFKRAPMRQILLHAHTEDHAGFVTELRRVVLDPTLRFHLRRGAMEVATRIDHASPELWRLFEEMLATTDAVLVREVWRVLLAAPSWLPFLHGKGLVAAWLASHDQEQRRRAVILVRNRIKKCPGDCVDLLSPYVGVSEEWNRDILHTVWHRSLRTDRRVFDLFMRLHAAGAVPHQSHVDFWSCIYDLPKTQPEWAAEALGQHLRFAVANTRAEDIEWHFLPPDGTGEGVVLDIAKNAPDAFLEAVLPVFLEVVTRTACERHGKLASDRVWRLRTYREEPLSIEASMLQGIEDAFKTLAASSIPDFTRFLDVLRPHGDYDSVNFVVVRALAAAPQEFVESTVDYVLANPQRLECGWASGSGGDFSHWAARELLQHVGSQCSEETFARLEEAIVSYFPRWEKTKDGLKWRGDWQLLMLTALPAERLSRRGAARLGEWRRKFPDRVITPPIPSKVRFVGSPIDGNDAARMNDEQWLRAIETYAWDDHSHRRPQGFLEGGAHQLSGVLETETKRDPERFARLLASFPEGTHRYYYHAILLGLKESGADRELVFDVARRIHSLPRKPGHRYLCDAIVEFSSDEIPDDVLAIVGWCATEATDPETNDLIVKTQNASDEERPHDILASAINSARGAAARAVGTLLFDKAARVPFFTPYLEQMVRDPTVIVRSTVANALLAQFSSPEAADMVAECLEGGDAQRRGAVAVAEANLFRADCVEFTHATLPRFFDDPVKEIRDEAATCFRRAKDRDLEMAKPIIRAFLASEAFAENVADLVWPMKRSTADIAEEILLTCEAVVSHMEALDNDPTHRLHGQADRIAELVLRAYRQMTDATERSRCLDIIDRLLAQEAHGISKELEEFER